MSTIVLPNPLAIEAAFREGQEHVRSKRLDMAAAVFQRILASDPEHAPSHERLGTLYHVQGNTDQAIAHFRAVVRLKPDDPMLMQRLVQSFRGITSTQPDELLRSDLVLCLENETVDHQHLLWVSLAVLRATTDIRNLLECSAGSDTPSTMDAIRDGMYAPLVSDRLLILLLQQVTIQDIHFERFFTTTRHALLRLFGDPSRDFLTSDDWLEFAAALAHQCFLNEYVYAQTDDEAQRLVVLRHWLENIKLEDLNRSEIRLAIFGAYMPLGSLANAEALTVMSEGQPPKPTSKLVHRQIVEPNIERDLFSEIEGKATFDNAVSLRVRCQYEENPYPRWLRIPNLSSVSPGSVIRTALPQVPGDTISLPQELRVLVAGCGTGRHAIYCATRYRGATVLGIDLSVASLAFATRKSDELNLENIEFSHLDILCADELGETFDLIESVGVLHHLEDPLQGWQILTDILAPGGYMNICLYSEAGRRAIVAAKCVIDEHGFAPTIDGIRQGRAVLKSLPEASLAGSVVNLRDFYAMSACRDMLFHVQEHRFDLLRLSGYVDQLGLEFLGFQVKTPAVMEAYHARFPDDTRATSFENWRRFECEHPLTFMGMYNMWFRKPGGSHRRGGEGL